MNQPNQMSNQTSVMSDNQEYEQLAGLTMEEAQVLLKALYIVDTHKPNSIVRSAFPSPIYVTLKEHS